jgi:Flp pilus assembly protein TadD
LKLDPAMFAGHISFGRAALAFRGYDDARHAFERALALRPGDFDATLGLAVALRGLGDADGAEALYRKAAAIDPARPEPEWNLGVLYQDFKSGSADDMRRAREHLQRFVQKAAQQGVYEEVRQEALRRCEPSARRQGKSACRVGRLQTIEQYLAAMEDG